MTTAVMTANQEINIRLELVRLMLKQALTIADEQEPDGELLDHADEELLLQALTLISRVQRRRS